MGKKFKVFNSTVEIIKTNKTLERKYRFKIKRLEDD
jgi:hypothetical protein